MSSLINTTVLVITCLCVSVCVCVLPADLPVSHTLPAGDFGILKHVLSNAVNRLMGRVMKVGLKHADFRLELNLVHFMHAWNYLESRHELKLQGVLPHALNLREYI